MARNFRELRAQLSPEALAESQAEYLRLVEEMSLYERRKAKELTQVKIAEEFQSGGGPLPDGRGSEEGRSTKI